MPIIERDSNFYSDSSSGVSGTVVSQNPVFKVSVRSLDTNYEEPANQQTKNSQDDIKFNIGDIISGQNIDNKSKIHKGKIINIKKNTQNEISYLEILDSKTGKKIKLNYQSCSKLNNPPATNIDDLNNTAYSAESLKYILSFDEFLDNL